MIVIPATQQIYLDAMEAGTSSEPLSRQVPSSVHRPVVRVWADIWEFWQQANAAYPQLTETLSDVWDM